MKRIVYLFLGLVVLSSVSCQRLKDEWTPVFTGSYGQPEPFVPETLRPTHSIAELVAFYDGEPVEIGQNVIISGKVSTTDRPGNFYKSLYIQDETAGIELKIGRNALYNEYLPGQTLYVKCAGLTIGMYGFKAGKGQGMVSIGYKDPSFPEEGSYETSYLESQLLIDTHIYRGATGAEVEAETITASKFPGTNVTQATNRWLGRKVRIEGLKYADEIFTLLYVDANKDKTSKNPANRIFFSSSEAGAMGGDATFGITSWALSADRMKQLLYSGLWDNVPNSDASRTIGSFRGDGTYPGLDKAACTVSQYFTVGGKTIQIRTSGFCKFADAEIPAEVRSGGKTITACGILSLYQGSLQLTVNSLDDITIDE